MPEASQKAKTLLLTLHKLQPTKIQRDFSKSQKEMELVGYSTEHSALGQNAGWPQSRECHIYILLKLVIAEKSHSKIIQMLQVQKT